MSESNEITNPSYDDTETSVKYKNVRSTSILSENNLEETYDFDELEPENVFLSAGHYLKKYYKPNSKNISRYFFKRFPFFDWIRDYDLKSDLAKDLTAGLTVNKNKL